MNLEVIDYRVSEIGLSDVQILDACRQLAEENHVAI